PPYILRASLVSKRWRRLATDPKFLRRFRVHHRRPPLLGVFSSDYKRNISFRSTLDPPYRIPPERFSLPLEPWPMLDCRHGRVLFVEKKRHQLIVWDPITDHYCFVAGPPLFKIGVLSGAVLCAAADQGHVHGDCRSSPFKVVVLAYAKHDDQEAGCVASVYYSETGIWSDLISTTLPWRPVALFRSFRQRMAALASPLCWAPTITPASKCGRGRSILMVLPDGCCGELLNCRRFLDWGLGLRRGCHL
uniref:F-box domain-containing protein n=1 Tax=Aegilops tauschii subsp. strangulata TaxID=200361 RepID=A0A453FZZ3_AEGTS